MEIPEMVQWAYQDSAKYFPTQLQQFMYLDKYSRFNYDLGRREVWSETVDRTVSFLKELSENKLSNFVYEEIREGILSLQVIPSMRLLAMAGDAARRNNLCLFNCAYLSVDSLDSFCEALLISMCGCGVGYSVESQYTKKLPVIQYQENYPKETYAIEDTTEGWVKALRLGLGLWFTGEDITFDYSQIRQGGTPLRVKGGTASGPEPLRVLLDYTRKVILRNQGRRLSSLECHDLMCIIGTAAVSGGVRRTALISLFDKDDESMIRSKFGDFDRENSQRWNANNSIVWENPLSLEEIQSQFELMHESGRGEPGFYSRYSARSCIPTRREWREFGGNPCNEVILRPMQLCNLSAAVCRFDDTEESLLNKVRLATIIGTIQSTATNFPGLRPQWKFNCDEERLLGVDLNGQSDCPLIQDSDILEMLREEAIEVNKSIASLLGINQSAAITCVKPSGNSSQFLDCSSGLHPRWSAYYVRNVRVSAHSPIFQVLKEHNVPMDPENGQTRESATTWVIHFPVKSPEGAVTRHQVTALDQCETWKRNKLHWTEHNPSITVAYSPEELPEIIQWMYEHQQILGGMAFLPKSDALYSMMPYCEISKEEFERLDAEFPIIDFSHIYLYEHNDMTTATQELSCSAGLCYFAP